MPYYRYYYRTQLLPLVRLPEEGYYVNVKRATSRYEVMRRSTKCISPANVDSTHDLDHW